MSIRSNVFAVTQMFLILSVGSTSSLASSFHSCYALKNANESDSPSQSELNQICLSEEGRVSLYGPSGFRYDFNVKAKFFPSTYSCHINSHTGDQHCGNSRPYIYFSGQDAHAEIDAAVDTQPDWTNHGALFVTFDETRYIFWDNEPL